MYSGHHFRDDFSDHGNMPRREGSFHQPQFPGIAAAACSANTLESNMSSTQNERRPLYPVPLPPNTANSVGSPLIGKIVQKHQQLVNQPLPANRNSQFQNYPPAVDAGTYNYSQRGGSFNVPAGHGPNPGQNLRFHNYQPSYHDMQGPGGRNYLGGGGGGGYSGFELQQQHQHQQQQQQQQQHHLQGNASFPGRGGYGVDQRNTGPSYDAYCDLAGAGQRQGSYAGDAGTKDSYASFTPAYTSTPYDAVPQPLPRAHPPAPAPREPAWHPRPLLHSTAAGGTGPSYPRYPSPGQGTASARPTPSTPTHMSFPRHPAVHAPGTGRMPPMPSKSVSTPAPSPKPSASGASSATPAGRGDAAAKQAGRTLPSANATSKGRTLSVAERGLRVLTGTVDQIFAWGRKVHDDVRPNILFEVIGLLESVSRAPWPRSVAISLRSLEGSTTLQGVFWEIDRRLSAPATGTIVACVCRLGPRAASHVAKKVPRLQVLKVREVAPANVPHLKRVAYVCNIAVQQGALDAPAPTPTPAPTPGARTAARPPPSTPMKQTLISSFASTPKSAKSGQNF